MKKIYISMMAALFAISTWAIAEEAELLDTYLEDLPSSNASQSLDSGIFVGQPVDVVVDENGQPHEVVRPQAVEYRRIETADGSELYEEVPIHAATPVTIVGSDAEVQGGQDLEIITLEPDDGEFVVIEANGSEVKQTVAATSQPAVSGHAFCQQNPQARECLLSKYLSLCEKDPQSTDCKSQLNKFDGFCETFPNAYKCKKAKIAASCQENPSSGACKTFTQRYCQKYPKAVFCNYN
ncbi:MAG: hypothetical protein AB8B92_05440 [Gammaproteobacteria bacterium]